MRKHSSITAESGAEVTEGFLTEYPDPTTPGESASKEQRAATLSMLLLALAGVGSQASTAHAETVGYGGPLELSIVPEVPSVQVGTPLVADVFFSNLNNTFIGAYDLSITFDPALLSVSNVTYNTFLDGPNNSIQGSTSSLGSLEIFEVSLANLATQSGFGTLPLFDITFNSLAAGTSPLAFDAVANGGLTVSDAIGNAFSDFTTVDSSVTITGGSGGSLQAPELDSTSAVSGLTFLAGSLFLIGGRRRRNGEG